MAVLVEIVAVAGGAAIQDGIEGLARFIPEEFPDQILDIRFRVDLGFVEAGLEVVKLIGIGLPAQDG